MEETKILEVALKNCHLLERMLQDSLRTVRRLNVRYNIDWLVLNYKSYVNSIWEHYENTTTTTKETTTRENTRMHLEKLEKYSSVRGSVGCLSTVSPLTTARSRRHTVSSAQINSTGVSTPSTSSKVSSTNSSSYSSPFPSPSSYTVSRRVQREKLSHNWTELDQHRNKLNYNVIKIKRSLETILTQLQRAIDISNRQSNYIHHGHGKGKDFICCH